MDCKIWNKIIIAWVNSLKSGPPIFDISDLKISILVDIIKKFNSDILNPIDFLKNVFPNLDTKIFTSNLKCNSICAATFLLIFVSFSKRSDLDEIKEKMCKSLDNFTQEKMAEFFINIQNHGDVFLLSVEDIKKEISNFHEISDSKNSIIGDCIQTPVKSNITNNSFDSPLQGFFQTPTKSREFKDFTYTSSVCGDGDHIKQIKKLTNQLVEEELERTSLQEKLNNSILKCNDFEMKLTNKIKEIQSLKNEWEKEARKNEEEAKTLKEKFIENCKSEERLKSELAHLENYISKMEFDLSNSKLINTKLEQQLKLSLDKCTAYELDIKEASELNEHLKCVIKNKENELLLLKENFMKEQEDEHSIDMSSFHKSFDSSMAAPENMGVVIDQLLREKVEENNVLQENIELLQTEKKSLSNVIENLKEEITKKDSTISEIQFLNKELATKIENFFESEKELHEKQKELVKVNAEVNKIMQENSYLTEKCHTLNASLKDKDQLLKECKNSKLLLHMNFLKLAEDFKSVQQRLEYEVKNITNLPFDNEQIINKKSEPYDEMDKFIEETNDFCKSFLPSKEIPTLLNYPTSYGDNKLEKLTELLNYFENHHFDWSESKISMQETCKQLNNTVIALKMKINEIEGSNNKINEEKLKLEKSLKVTEDKILEMEYLHSFEIKKLKEELQQKENKILELENLLVGLKRNENNLIREKEILTEQATKLERENEKKLNKFNVITSNNSSSLNNIHIKTQINKDVSINSPEKQELQDSLEEIPVCNKTFDIVHLEDKNIYDKTFSIKKEDLSTNNIEKNNSASWFVSPPSKNIKKKNISNVPRREKKIVHESWVVPVNAVKKQEKSTLSSISQTKEKSVKRKPSLTKSSSLSSILEINYSPPSKNESNSKINVPSFTTTTEEINQIDGDVPKRSEKKTFKSNTNSEHYTSKTFKLIGNQINPLDQILTSDNEQSRNEEWDKSFTRMRKEIIELSKECENLRMSLSDSEQKRKNDKEAYEKNQDDIRKNITAKYEGQLQRLKNEMKQLYNRELAKHKTEQSKLNTELQQQSKRLKEHNDELINQLWELGEKLLQEQKLKRDLERNNSDLKKKLEQMVFNNNLESKCLKNHDIYKKKESLGNENRHSSIIRQLPSAKFPIIPTEDEEEIFDNRFLEDMKAGIYPADKPEGRLMELQSRNTMCKPHLKSSYPAETQFHNLSLFNENELKFGLLQFGQESQSLTDSDHSMTRSLIPEHKVKKKEQTSYKKPGPPTPSKNGGRVSIQSVDVRLTPRSALKELNEQSERNKGTPSRFKTLNSKNLADENTVPVMTPRKKVGKFFRKPFGARDH